MPKHKIFPNVTFIEFYDHDGSTPTLQPKHIVINSRGRFI